MIEINLDKIKKLLCSERYRFRVRLILLQLGIEIEQVEDLFKQEREVEQIQNDIYEVVRLLFTSKGLREIVDVGYFVTLKASVDECIDSSSSVELNFYGVFVKKKHNPVNSSVGKNEIDNIVTFFGKEIRGNIENRTYYDTLFSAMKTIFIDCSDKNPMLRSGYKGNREESHIKDFLNYIFGDIFE